jgi:hypothetical protein
MMKVEAISTKEVRARGKMVPTYSFKCDDGQWYGLGFNKPPFEKGAEVEFEVESTPYGAKAKFETIKIHSGAATAPSGGMVRGESRNSSFSPRSTGFQQKVFPIPALHGDRSIVRQNALTNAREMVMTMEQLMGNTIANTAQTQDAMAQAIIRVARQFEAYSAGDIERLGADEQEKK